MSFAMDFLTTLSEELAQEMDTLERELEYRTRRNLDDMPIKKAIQVTYVRLQGVLKSLGEIKAANGGPSWMVLSSTPAPKPKPKRKKVAKKTVKEESDVMAIAKKFIEP